MTSPEESHRPETEPLVPEGLKQFLESERDQFLLEVDGIKPPASDQADYRRLLDLGREYQDMYQEEQLQQVFSAFLWVGFHNHMRQSLPVATSKETLVRQAYIKRGRMLGAMLQYGLDIIEWHTDDETTLSSWAYVCSNLLMTMAEINGSYDGLRDTANGLIETGERGEQIEISLN